MLKIIIKKFSSFIKNNLKNDDPFIIASSSGSFKIVKYLYSLKDNKGNKIININ